MTRPPVTGACFNYTCPTIKNNTQLLTLDKSRFLLYNVLKREKIADICFVRCFTALRSVKITEKDFEV